MKLDDQIHGLSTLLGTRFQSFQSQGTGFFFQELGPKDPTKGDPQWRTVESIWIITNRHVVLPKISGNEVIPDLFVFNLRKEENGKIVWEPIILNQQELISRVKLSADPTIDVAAIRVDDLVMDKLNTTNNILPYFAVSEENLPGMNNISVEVTDDVVVIGYPRGFYDEANVFPIVKSGIVATRWGLNFNDQPLFLIDSKLFPGSSGSIVISKPINTVVANGQMMFSDIKQFAFLGVYSGEPYRQHKPVEFEDFTFIKKDSYNVGNVWYSQLVIDIIKNGVSPK